MVSQSLSDSPFSEHVRVNYIPSTTERAHIAELLIAPQSELPAIDAEIAELQRMYNEIHTRKENLDNLIAEHKTLLSPFRRIPDSVLRVIFIYCLPSQHNALMMLSEAPLLFGQICRRWRRVALNTPYLWSTLHISPLSPFRSANKKLRHKMIETADPRVQSQIQAIFKWLSHSGTCPLSVSINDWMKDDDVYVQILLLFSHRWFNIRLRVDSQPTSSALASLSPRAVPMLEVLQLTFSGNWNAFTSVHDHLQWQTNGGILRAANLRMVAIHLFPLNLDTIEELDWSHLTTLILCDFRTAGRRSSPSEARMILSRCRNLVHFTMAVHDLSMTESVLPLADQSLPSSFDLPFLETISVNDYYYSMASLFQRVHAPSLTHVLYSSQFRPSSDRPSPLIALLQRNGLTVRSLTFDPRHLTCAELIGCFKMTPFLTTLVCQQSRISPRQEQFFGRDSPVAACIMKGLLQLLTPNIDQGRTYWPILQYITCADSFGLEELSVLAFIQRRMTSAALNVLPLKEVTMTFGRIKPIDISSLLREYTDNGSLRLVLHGYWDVRASIEASPGRFSPSAGIRSPYSPGILPEGPPF